MSIAQHQTGRGRQRISPARTNTHLRTGDVFCTGNSFRRPETARKALLTVPGGVHLHSRLETKMLDEMSHSQDSLIVCKSAPRHLGALVELRRDGAHRLQRRGFDDWFHWDVASATEADHEAGGLYVVVAGTEVVAGIRVSGEGHPDLWLDHERREKSAYGDRFVVKRRYGAAGLGRLVLEWLADRAAREGLAWVRADTWGDHRALQRYYLGLGFQHVRTARLPDTGEVWLAQLPTGTSRVRLHDADSAALLPAR